MTRESLDRRAFLAGRFASTHELVPAISEACFAARGIVCQTCGDVCPEAAIQFRMRIGGPAMPLLAADRCTACGECIAACPADAIRLATTTEGSAHG